MNLAVGLSRACLLVAALAALPAAAEPVVTVTTSHYDIKGSSIAQLKAQLAQHGPGGYWAYTTWFVRWSGGCKLSVEISYTYPRWTNRGSASSSVRDRWDRMIRNLTVHEEGHGRIGMDAAREIEASGCRGDPMRIIGKWNRYEKDYDIKTRHGATQGATLD